MWRGHLQAREGGIEWYVGSRILVGARWPRNCYVEEGELLAKGIWEQRGGERKRGEGENKGEEWVRVVFVEEQRGGTWTKIGPVMEMRGPGGQWVSGPGPLNS